LNDITHYAGSSRGFNVALKREGGKRREKGVITTQGIRIWSPIQVLSPYNKQLLDEVEHDIMNYQNRGLCYLPDIM